MLDSDKCLENLNLPLLLETQRKTQGGVLFTADLSERNLGATRTALNNSRANLLSSLCGNVLPSQRPPGCPAPLSRNQPVQGRCQGNTAPICVFPVSALTSPDALPIARPKIDARLRLMSPPGSLHQREGAAQLAGSRCCESRGCYFPCDVWQVANFCYCVAVNAWFIYMKMQLVG